MNHNVKETCLLIDFLLKILHGSSKTKIRKLLQHGSVLVEGVPVKRGDVEVLAGQTVEIKRASKIPDNTLPFPVLYEDQYLIAVEKPYGMLSMSKYEDKSDTFLHTVNQALRFRPHFKTRVFLVHRLDRDVSGIMVFAFSAEIKRILQSTWETTEKLYYALVEGKPPQQEGVIRSWLKEGRMYRMYSCEEGEPDAKLSITHYRQIKEYPAHTLLEIRLETGRKNQIRVHLADIGCPIVGDEKYGAKGNPIKRLGLHAFSFSFNHPITGKRIELKIPIPPSFDLKSRELKSKKHA